MLIGLNKGEGCTVVINHTDNTKTHSICINNIDNEKLCISEFNCPNRKDIDRRTLDILLLGYKEGQYSHQEVVLEIIKLSNKKNIGG